MSNLFGQNFLGMDFGLFLVILLGGPLSSTEDGPFLVLPSLRGLVEYGRDSFSHASVVESA
ncbi:hypothetical protein, partial [Allobacillus salarius]|uniref:hypothetical protein n=1 Tax=Allobacillus salarius TaxID=1955272 RepID=UPI001C915EF9